jgi:hypothetical protein
MTNTDTLKLFVVVVFFLIGLNFPDSGGDDSESTVRSFSFRTARNSQEKILHLV